MSEISAAVKIEDISPVKKKLFFDIPWPDVKNELDAVYRKVGKTARIKGFRPGKIPKEILEKHYREDAEEQTVANLVNQHYWAALQEKEIPAVSHPDIDQQGITEDNTFSFSATVEVEPQIEPRDYIGLELEKEDLAVTEEEVAARMSELQQLYATMEDVQEDRGIILGDFATIDFKGTLEGESLKELQSENHLLEIGSKKFVPGFEEQLVGLRCNESRTISVKFPDDYTAAHLAGKDVEFEVFLKGLRIKKLPEIDEQFVKNFDRFDSLEALKADVLKDLELAKKHNIEIGLEKQIESKLLENNSFELPEALVERQIQYMVSQMEQRMIYRGVNPKKSHEFSVTLRDTFREEAGKTVKIALLLRNIAEKEGLKVEEDEVEERIREMAAQRNQEYDAFRALLEKDDIVDNIRSGLLTRKTYDFIETKSSVKTVSRENKAALEVPQ